MNVLITGGAGFIGTHTARSLHAAGHQIRILDVLDPQIHGENASFSDELLNITECVRGDVCDVADCTRALEGIDCVFHFASRTGIGQSMYDMKDYVATNVLGTASLIEAIVAGRIPLKRFVLSSSRAVYDEGMFRCGEHGAFHPSLRDPQTMQAGDFSMHCPECDAQMSAQPTPVDCPSDPLSIYAITKQQQEDYCLHATHTFDPPLVTLRHFKVYVSMQSLQEPYMRECFGWANGQTSVNQYDKTVAELRTRGLFRKADG